MSLTSMKFKYTLDEANKKIKELKGDFPYDARIDYMKATAMAYSTLYKYINRNCPSPAAADHLVRYMELYVKEHPPVVA